VSITKTPTGNGGSLPPNRMFMYRLLHLRECIGDINEFVRRHIQQNDEMLQLRAIRIDWTAFLEVLNERAIRSGNTYPMPGWLATDPIRAASPSPHGECADGFVRAVRNLIREAAEMAGYQPHVMTLLLTLELRYREVINSIMLLTSDDQDRWHDLPDLGSD
jgi:hypothetical protein